MLVLKVLKVLVIKLLRMPMVILLVPNQSIIILELLRLIINLEEIRQKMIPLPHLPAEVEAIMEADRISKAWMVLIM